MFYKRKNCFESLYDIDYYVYGFEYDGSVYTLSLSIYTHNFTKMYKPITEEYEEITIDQLPIKYQRRVKDPFFEIDVQKAFVDFLDRLKDQEKFIKILNGLRDGSKNMFGNWKK